MHTSYVIRICKKILPVGMIFYFWLHKRLASKTEMMNFRMKLEQKKFSSKLSYNRYLRKEMEFFFSLKECKIY